MLAGRVIHYEIHDDANAALLSIFFQAIEIGERPVHRIDIFVVGYVVAEIDLWRGITGREPDGIDAETLQIIHFRIDADEVANAVAIAVHKTARIDFVKHGVLPPLVAFGVDWLSLGVKRKGQAD